MTYMKLIVIPFISIIPNAHNRDENDKDLIGRSLGSVRVAIIADTSELAYTIPILLDGIGVLPNNITTLHDFESSNEVMHCLVISFLVLSYGMSRNTIGYIHTNNTLLLILCVTFNS